MRIPKNVSDLLEKLNKDGRDAYVVGGSLRDAMISKEAHDWDITCSARPDEVMALFEDYRVIPTGLKHGTVTVISDGEPIEITTFRRDGEYLDSRRPESVDFAKTVEDDLSRRDFTVNAMAYNERRGIVDLFGGKQDLDRKIIRCVGEPEKRFSEDALRIMRAFRFSSQLDFEIHPDTLNAAHKLKDNLKNIAKERIGSEFLRLLVGENPERALSQMGEIIEIVIGKSVDTQRFSKLSSIQCDAISRLAYLICGANIEEIILASHLLKLSSKESAKLQKLCSVFEEKDLEDLDAAKARRFLSRYGEDSAAALEIAVRLGKADAASVEFLRRIEGEKPCVSLQNLAINGSDLVEERIANGKMIGEILSSLLDAVIENPELNEREILLQKAKIIAQNHRISNQ